MKNGNTFDQHQFDIVQSKLQNVESSHSTRQIIPMPPTPETASHSTQTIHLNQASATGQKDAGNDNNDINVAVITSSNVITY